MARENRELEYQQKREARESESHQLMLLRDEAAKAVARAALGKEEGSEELMRMKEEHAAKAEEREERREGRDMARENRELEYQQKREARQSESHQRMLLRIEAAKAVVSAAQGKEMETTVVEPALGNVMEKDKDKS